MIKTLFIFAPAIVLEIVSFIFLSIGLLRLRSYLNTANVRYTSTSIHSFLGAGCLGLVGVSLIFAAASIYQRLLLFIFVIIGCLLSIVGEFLLYRSITHFRRIFVIWVSIAGNILCTVALPILLQMREPFIFIYVFCVYTTLFAGHIWLIGYWSNKKGNYE